MIIYCDVTKLEHQRINTGIQRVVKEFLHNAIQESSPILCKVLIYNKQLQKMQIVPNDEMQYFLDDIENYKFIKKKTIIIETIKASKTTIFFDIDSAWNAPYKREELYPILKANGFYIFNFIHDLIPIYKPQFVQKIVINNYKLFIKTVYKHSDKVLFNSNCSQQDFIRYKTSLKIKRDIPMQVVGLGSDFISLKTQIKDTYIKSILSKKYILFVGTIEPRKNHKDALDAFDILSKKYTELNLVFIGMKGWMMDDFNTRINSHPLKDERLFWLTNINDDTLYHFYQNAFLVTYLSNYEGYGLPVVESLQHGNITITSKNSSMPEIGLQYADYVEDNNLDQLVSTILKYYENKDLYTSKKQDIKENYKAQTWQQFSELIFDNFKIFENIHKEKKRSFWAKIYFWSYNLLRLNNLKYTLEQQQKQIKQQQKQIESLQKAIYEK